MAAVFRNPAGKGEERGGRYQDVRGRMENSMVLVSASGAARTRRNRSPEFLLRGGRRSIENCSKQHERKYQNKSGSFATIKGREWKKEGGSGCPGLAGNEASRRRQWSTASSISSSLEALGLWGLGQKGEGDVGIK